MGWAYGKVEVGPGSRREGTQDVEKRDKGRYFER
jgi:hypothetical protein